MKSAIKIQDQNGALWRAWPPTPTPGAKGLPLVGQLSRAWGPHEGPCLPGVNTSGLANKTEQNPPNPHWANRLHN